MRSPRELRPEVPAGLEAICRKCLSKEADERYASARDVARALREWLEKWDNPQSTANEVKADAGNRSATRDGKWDSDRSVKRGSRPQRAPVWGLPRGPVVEAR